MGADPTDQAARLEARLVAGAGAGGKRILVVVNPVATKVTNRLKELVIGALRDRFRVDAIDTEAAGHATELARQAATDDYDAVFAFGGDGTTNEAACGLAGSSTALSCIPGGRANVYCRMLGIPPEVVDATEHLLRTADDWRPRPVDLADVNQRTFLFSAGVGLDASVVERVNAHPRLKARFGEWYYAWVGVRIFNHRYLLHPPRFEAELGGEHVRGVTAIVQNSTPYTYFGRRPVDIGEGARLDSRDLAGAVLKRANPIEVPTIMWRALSRNARVSRHRQIHPFTRLSSLRLRSLDDRLLPLQVDGDYIGEAHEAVFGVTPGGLLVVS